MTFENMRKKVVEENKFATEKELNRVVINLGLSILTSSVWLGLATISTVGLNLFVFTLFCLICMFILVCNYASENGDNFHKVKKVTKFWWANLIIIALVFFLLKLFYFI